MISKFIIFIVIVNYNLFYHIQARSVDDKTVEKFIGVWYGIATIDPLLSSGDLLCEWHNITRGENNGEIYDVSWKRVLGSFSKLEAHGTIVDSQVYFSYDNIAMTKTFVFDVISFNDGDELIFNESGSTYNYLISRKPTVSDEIKSNFRERAEKQHLDVTYVIHDNCLYTSN